MSSKCPVSRFREVVPVAKGKQRVIRDPQFEEMAGHLNPDLFKKSYAFVDELKKKEKAVDQERSAQDKECWEESSTTKSTASNGVTT